MKIPKYVLPHRVTVIKFKGSGAYGPIWDDANPIKNVPCRIDPQIKNIKGSNGNDVVQQAEATFHPDYKIGIGDKIQWDLMGTTYTAELITPIDAMGIHHFEVVLA
jgi:hypothetical protein